MQQVVSGAALYHIADEATTMAHENEQHGHLIHYKVDDEPESTSETFLTPTQIMSSAGIDPKTNYLEQLVPGHDPISYKDKPEDRIEMKEGLHFITKPIGAMPVS
jgi:hypothetical protein